uniref:Uncharacterized protein n=1 Tax=Vannella robusta TaxID=1487602 RepID=A0A7S4M935_9EUKA
MMDCGDEEGPGAADDYRELNKDQMSKKVKQLPWLIQNVAVYCIILVALSPVYILACSLGGCFVVGYFVLGFSVFYWLFVFPLIYFLLLPRRIAVTSINVKIYYVFDLDDTISPDDIAFCSTFHSCHSHGLEIRKSGQLRSMKVAMDGAEELSEAINDLVRDTI